MSIFRDYAAAVTQPTLPLAPSRDSSARFDEVVAPDGALRPAWRALAPAALDLSIDDVGRFEAEIAALLADDGVTFAPGGNTEQWRLDPVPLVVDAPTWTRLDVGLAQRTELLNALLADIYGERSVLRDGILPAGMVVGHAGFVRSLVRTTGTDPHPLLFAATDLGRDSDGEWRVVGDRVQAPSGLGYALENRRVLSQVLPEMFQTAPLHRVEPYFDALREALIAAAPEGREDPRVVVLSPGTLSETAYDQAALAGVLGFPLVQGSDLVVRDGKVWMKPTGWPDVAPRERVDVILRRVDAEWCDPLELRGDSQLGVAGLSEAARRGGVRLVNGLGAGVLENPALHAFMPALCERLLGEQLRLPGMPSWWCGTPEGLGEVEQRLLAGDPSLVVRTIDGSRAPLDTSDPRTLLERIRTAPHRYAGQELLPLSQGPAWSPGGRIDPRAIILRTFTVLHQSVYRPLIGGMASALAEGTLPASSKDVWVLKADPDELDQGLPDAAETAVVQSIPELSPRAIDDLFWSGRYSERAEDLLRLVLAIRSDADQLSTQGPVATVSTRVLTGAVQRLTGAAWIDVDDDFRSILLDAGRSGSVAHSLARLRATLEGVRDQLSTDTWRVFAATDRAASALRLTRHAHGVGEGAGRMLTALLALQGTTANMIRDAGWHMVEAGRALERSLQVCALLQAAVTRVQVGEVEQEVLEAVLRASESVVTHRRRYRGFLHARGVIELLVLDAENPRSVRFAVDRVREHISAQPLSTGSTRPERLIDEIVALLEELSSIELARATEGRRAHLERTLEDISVQIAELARAIEALHFSSGPPPQTFASLSLTELTGAAS
ncbi:circularly permuted type 2 ATP-grasp protein [Microbacterium sediminicola]|uniref:Circularly permuted type 2 ATP-grasp protein n=1 Tax=Microbacterium sediminicola TaxID=415210 RepID=A0ABP4UMI9_9MICO